MNALHLVQADLHLSQPCRWVLGIVALALLVISPATATHASNTSLSDESTTPEAEAVDSTEPSARSTAGCGCCRRGKGQPRGSSTGKGAACGMERGKGGAGGSAGTGRGHAARPEMQLAHFLIDNHDRLQREIELIPQGVRTRTTTEDPELIASLREHVGQMAGLIEGEGRIRNWDPLFREIFAHRDAIKMEIHPLDNGVEVVETSDDSQVVLLIQAHARKVDDFVARGRAAYQEETPLPDGYSATLP